MTEISKLLTVSPLVQKRVNSIVDIKQKPGEIEDAAFMHSILCQTFLPYRDPGDLREYERTQGNAVLLLKAGEVLNPATRKFMQVGLPYGPKARLVLAYINTWAIKMQTPVVPIEETLTSFVKKLGLDAGGRTINTVKDQLTRLAGSSIKVGYMTSNETAHTSKIDIISDMEMWLGKDEHQRVLWPGVVKLSDRFYNSLVDHAIPLDERVLGALSNNASALDIYVWLAQRLHRVSKHKPQAISWAALQDQFGSEYKEARKFRQHFRQRLELVQKFYTEARFEDNGRGLLLKNSPPPVQQERKIFIGNK